MKVAYWPGCVSRGFTPELHGSMAKVAPLLDIELVELDRALVQQLARRDVGATLWFTGLPSAGKSTVAHALADRLRGDGVDVEVLDGDEVRPHLSAGLGFTRADRGVNVRRIGWVARLRPGPWGWPTAPTRLPWSFRATG